ncbi:MAG: DUF512 domain-containing protein [Oscillospiraceae bacterium]|nr:DUF512 domain-containing protein [Oscillospiraceae bacterium]
MRQKIKSIVPGSPASRSRLRVGDSIAAVNGHEILDVLDYKYYTCDARLIIEAETARGGRKKVRIKKPEGVDVGLEFETYLMDRPRSCANKCLFCFIDQLPEGMRETLYFKDDDARLSFLTGNYITLTNLSQREIQRIMDLKISPINVSVHATDPEVRRRLINNRRAGECLDIMKRFAGAGIIMDCQIVCCPGINDGEVLLNTMHDLAALYPAVNSVSVVPVGLTKHRQGLAELKPFDKEGAAATIQLVRDFAAKCAEAYGSSIFFCADELYLKAELPLPDDDYYEGYPQLENGVGLVTLLTAEFRQALESAEGEAGEPFCIATGVSAAPILRQLLDEAKEKFPELDGRVYAIENDFFGHTINVAGLVTGGDLIKQLRGRELGSRILITDKMLRHGEGVFLDDLTLSDVEAELGVPLVPVERDGEALLRTILK